MRSFEPLLGHLPDGIRAHALTVRGHGDAPQAGRGLRRREPVGDVVAYLDEAGIERAIVAGHSMGSILATSLALDAPERVSGLVLMAGKPTYGDPALDPIYDEVRAFGEQVDPAWVRGFQESTLARPVPDAFLELVVEESLKLPARVWQALIDPTLRDRPLAAARRDRRARSCWPGATPTRSPRARTRSRSCRPCRTPASTSTPVAATPSTGRSRRCSPPTSRPSRSRSRGAEPACAAAAPGGPAAAPGRCYSERRNATLGRKKYSPPRRSTAAEVATAVAAPCPTPPAARTSAARRSPVR